MSECDGERLFHQGHPPARKCGNLGALKRNRTIFQAARRAVVFQHQPRSGLFGWLAALPSARFQQFWIGGGTAFPAIPRGWPWRWPNVGICLDLSANSSVKSLMPGHSPEWSNFITIAHHPAKESWAKCPLVATPRLAFSSANREKRRSESLCSAVTGATARARNCLRMRKPFRTEPPRRAFTPVLIVSSRNGLSERSFAGLLRANIAYSDGMRLACPQGGEAAWGVDTTPQAPRLMSRTEELDTIANNLANASTVGYRAQRQKFSAPCLPRRRRRLGPEPGHQQLSES